jgi:hypothetical protein
MVGHLGVGPSSYCLIRTALHRLGSGPREAEVSIPAVSRPPRTFKAVPPSAGHLPSHARVSPEVFIP